jgi:hypothetical protein
MDVLFLFTSTSSVPRQSLMSTDVCSFAIFINYSFYVPISNESCCIMKVVGAHASVLAPQISTHNRKKSRRQILPTSRASHAGICSQMSSKSFRRSFGLLRFPIETIRTLLHNRKRLTAHHLGTSKNNWSLMLLGSGFTSFH